MAACASKKRESERLFPRGREPVSEPSCGEEPAQKSQERGQAQDAEIRQKPHGAVVRDFSIREPKASEPSAEKRMTREAS